MADWFAEAFGAAVADIRAKLVEEGVWGRKVPEPSSTRYGQGLSPVENEPSLLDRLYSNHPEHFAPTPDAHGHTPDRGIDR